MSRPWILVRMRDFFPACRKRQLLASSIWVRRCVVLASIFHFKENDGTIGAALLHQILPETGRQQVETIRKIHTVFGDDAMGITQI